MLVIFILVAAVLLGLALEKRRKKSAGHMTLRPNYYSKLKPADKLLVKIWLFAVALDAILMAVFGGWLLVFGAVYIIPQAIAVRLSARILLIDRWKAVSLVTKILTSYIFAVIIIFTRAFTDANYNSFILFGTMPKEGSGLDAFLSRFENGFWISAVIAMIALLAIYIASRKASSASSLSSKL